ncbi:hypothetical protein Aperf_G00000008910 [Anoplocephala perfoliata]
MTEGVDTLKDISAQLKAIQADVLEFNVGVSHLALDEERERYTRIRERIELIIASLNNSKGVQGKSELENAKRLLTVTTGNTATLRYLESISCLESIFSEAAKAAAVTVVSLSTEDSISEQVLASRFLTENVKQCWDYAAQLSNLTAIHLKTAADFHIFNHEINEVRAHAAQMKIDSDIQLKAFSPIGVFNEVTSLSEEMNDRLKAFQDLADRSQALASKAPSILPIENRLIEVTDGVARNNENCGPITVQMLIDYVGSNNFTARKGDLFPLLNTTDSRNLWQVMTQSGPQYVPSLACIIASPNGAQVHDAHETLGIVKSAWNDSLENYRRQLAFYYWKYLQNILDSRDLHVTDLYSERRFLEDLDRLLVRSGADEGRLVNILNTLSSGKVSRPGQTREVWNGRELSILHQPLLIFYEHTKALRRIDENVNSFTTRMQDYASTITMETRGLRAQLDSLRLTHDRNTAELKRIYDRVQNWRPAYRDFIERPRGIGRLYPLSLSSSSGISSEEIPQPPSPIGRITPVEIESDSSVQEFLETKPQGRPKMKSLTLGAEAYVPKAKVFAGGAVKQPRQVKATASVRPIEKPTMIRDVATTTPIKNIQTATTQSQRNRVDSMTQIGFVKAQKAQQVDTSIITAALETSQKSPVYATVTQVSNFGRALVELETEPQSLDSAVFEAHAPTGTLDFQAKKNTRGIITQVDKITKNSGIVTQTEPTASIGVGSKPEYAKSAFQVNPQELVSGSTELKRPVGNTQVQSGFERVSSQLETVPQSSKSFDVQTQILQQPKVSGMVNVKPQQTSFGQQMKREDTSFYELNAANRSLSDIDLQISGKEMVETEVINSRKPKVAAKCTCLKTSSKEFQTTNNLTPCTLSCALHDPICFHFVKPCYASCETPRKQIDAATRTNEPAETGLHHMNVKEASKLLSSSVIPSTKVGSQETKYKDPQIYTQELNFKVKQTDNYTMSLTPDVAETELTASPNNNRRLRETVNQSTCPTCNSQLETHWPSAAINQTSTAKRSLVTNWTQVGTVLEPVKVQVIEIIPKPKAPPEVRNFGVEVQNILCPSTVELVSSLAETSGIKVKDVCEVDAVNISKGESTFNANVRKSTTEATSVPKAHAQQGDADCRRIGAVLGETSTPLKKSDAFCISDKVILQEAKFEIISAVREDGEVRNGTGSRFIGGLETRGKTPVSSTTCQEIKDPAKFSIGCQVGAILRPTRAYLANVEIKARTPELARQMGITPNAIICPSTVELQTELAEHAGIQVVDVKEAGDMEFVAGTALGEASFKARSSESRRQSIPGRRPFMKNMNIVHEKSGLTIGQGEVRKTAADSAQNTETFDLQDVGCQFAIKKIGTGTICAHCRGRIEQSMTTSSPDHSASIDLSRKPSFIHQRSSTPLSKAVGCQVGIVLRPMTIQVANIGVKPRSRTIAEYLGMNVDSVLCPAKVQVVPELREAPGIEVVSVTDTAHLGVQAGEGVINADIQSRRPRAPITSVNSQRKPHLLLNLQANPNALTIGQSSPHVPLKSTSTMGENFTLSDVGCEVVLRGTDFGRICVNCQGTGRMTNAQVQSLPKTFENGNLEISQQYSSLMHATMGSKTIHAETKSCQVGTILTPTSVNIGSVEMLPKSTTSAVSSASVIYPAAVELESKLTETPGIQIKEVADMETVSVTLGQKFKAKVYQNKPLPETCVLEVKSSHPNLSTAVSSGKFNLRNIGCEFRLKEATTPSIHPHPLINSFETGRPQPGEAGLRTTSVPRGKNASSQVGLSLIPKTIQIADMSANATDRRVAAGLGLKADAVICPSTVDLEMKLTEAAGVTVSDVKDVREVGIKIGDNRGLISITGRNMKAFDPDSAYMIFVSNKSTASQEIRPSSIKLYEANTSAMRKTFDQRARCTFQVRQTDETDIQPRSSKDITKSDVGCQVGVLMVLETMKVSSAKMVVEEKASADIMGVSIPSTLQASTYELQPRISERAGIQVAQMNDIEQVKLQLGGQVYKASVINGSKTPPARTTTSRTWGRSVASTIIPSPIQRAEASVSNTVGPYLLTLREGATETRSIVDVAGLTLGGKSLQLRVDTDLRGKLTMQTGQTSSGRKFSGFLDSSQRSTSAGSQRSVSGRPNSRLCDVACEALIKPETIEKRIQTFFM